MTSRNTILSVGLSLGGLLLLGLAFASAYSHSARSGPSSTAAIANIGVLVFREGLECVLVLAAIAAGSAQTGRAYRRAIAIGVGTGFTASLLTWDVAVRILSDLSQSVSALVLQAATGLIAVVVLLIVMNWFFHKLYWTGWISAHSQERRRLLEGAKSERISRSGVFWGMALLGFTSVYREGFEVVLFLQGYRLKLGSQPVSLGLSVGLFLSGIVAILTFLAHRKLPYRKMLVLTGILLGIVLIVMVGEQAQEMQLAHWIPTTRIHWLSPLVPPWTSLWFSVFPTVETLLAQLASALLVLGSYFVATRETVRQTATRVLEPGP